ncbi:MAG: PAS domain-containing protein [Proteobacteria bacterium]|nr:PAS domain-containing protein [Pseudomonadota bacterium]MBU4470365.1 PAS domain-containing protein [Pseudomonadota bacterium]MCG2752776.1 PAS domain-containing protein [Desulfobacteraceae bacterium]
MKIKAKPGTGRKKPTTVLPEPSTPGKKNIAFPIVGIGASAGGLEALEQFLGNVPEGSGMAFVIVQHLDPTRKGMMPELLSRATRMKVSQVRDRMKVQPDCVYVIPPNKDMSILNGVLHLFTPKEPRGLRLAIDFFFRSLADDMKERSIGVILSGMGTDGTLGIKAIKEKGGLVLVQEAVSAKFGGMPSSAILTGVPDIVAPATALPGKIAAYLQHAHLIEKRQGVPMEDISQSALDKIIILLRTQTGHDFSQYKKNTIYRRIERRMGIHQITKIATYVRFLQENPQEQNLLFKELLIGVTGFFRDPAAWEKIAQQALPGIMDERTEGGTLRAWSAACSTGEEVYSLAITFKEVLEKRKIPGNITLQIYATDLDSDAVNKARQGLYPFNISADVSAERLKRFFVKEDTGYRINKEIREMAIFAVQDVIMDPPFTKLDILCCRNLLIYLTPEMQKKLLPVFHYSLNPNGILFLGNSETTGASADLFTPVDAKARLFKRRENAVHTQPLHFPPTFTPAVPVALMDSAPSKAPVNFQTLVDQLILQQVAPATVLVNSTGDILYISGRTGKYLEPAAGKANWNIFAMIREGMRSELAHAFKNALLEKVPVNIQGALAVDGSTQPVDINIRAIKEPEALMGMLIIAFADAPTPKEAQAPVSKKKSKQVTELEQKFRQAREEVRMVREDMQTSQEELKSANEELQSANQELQSINEELTTSKEEMQSLNEELQTVNTELQTRVYELSRVSNDMENLLNSTDIAAVFLDNDLNVRRFTTQAAKIIKLIPGDIDRPITDIASTLIYPTLTEDAGEVLQKLAYREKEIASTDGGWFSARIMPYRTHNNVIDGVVITFSDITAGKTLEARLRQTHEELEIRVAERTAELAAANKALQAEVLSHRKSLENQRKTLKNAKKEARTNHEKE